jgi:hypothetical protein
MNWLNNFIEEQKTRAENKRFLKKTNLENREISIIQELGNLTGQIIDLRTREPEIKEIKTIYVDLVEELEILKYELSKQKGRITRQTNEQNKELKDFNKKFALMFKKLETITR